MSVAEMPSVGVGELLCPPENLPRSIRAGGSMLWGSRIWVRVVTHQLLQVPLTGSGLETTLWKSDTWSGTRQAVVWDLDVREQLCVL